MTIFLFCILIIATFWAGRLSAPRREEWIREQREALEAFQHYIGGTL
jgi:hypothetical protein